MKELIYEKTVFAPRGGKPGYIVNGKWYPVDQQDLGSESLKKEMEKYGKLRGIEQIQKDISSLKPKPAPTQQPPAQGKGERKSGESLEDFTRRQSAELQKDYPTTSTTPATPPASTTPATPPASTTPATPPASKTRPAPKPLETRMSSVTGKREFVGTTAGGTKFERRAATGAELRAAQAARKEALVSKPEDKKGAEEEAVKAGVGASRPSGAPSYSTSTSSSPIQAPKPASSTPAPKPAPSASPAPPKKETDPKPVRLPVVPFKDSYEYDAYDLVLEYLLSQGHADTLEEANYVMLEMDAEMIGDIVDIFYK